MSRERQIARRCAAASPATQLHGHVTCSLDHHARHRRDHVPGSQRPRGSAGGHDRWPGVRSVRRADRVGHGGDPRPERLRAAQRDRSARREYARHAQGHRAVPRGVRGLSLATTADRSSSHPAARTARTATSIEHGRGDRHPRSPGAAGDRERPPGRPCPRTALRDRARHLDGAPGCCSISTRPARSCASSSSSARARTSRRSPRRTRFATRFEPARDRGRLAIRSRLVWDLSGRRTAG